uniref:glycine betaine/L-proline ABC transporter substrate-binding protein ProX n=1 Tax=Thaumasiovibrio occultus TaxID=1891184 RepID=UPI000B351B9C|nr:glycine betaine/L-proline ABC transporter substrate-binding protein ProX [Thaumasiovibrio occultus]
MKANGLTLLSGMLACALSASAFADSLPGEGISVQPIQSSVAEETFQTLIVSRALEALGYDVQPVKEVDYNVGYAAIANGEGTFLAVNWAPLHEDKFESAGGDEAFFRDGHYVSGAAQGYLIDKATAEEYGITNVGQLKDPEIAKLFDANADGKADLAGCDPGWGCENVINHQIGAFELSDTVTHNQGLYSVIITDTIARYNAGEPILYYTWTPYWVSGVLVPGKDVVWLEVPFSSLPGARSEVDTTLANGKNYGFEMNSMRIVANREFADANPAAAFLFANMTLDINDVSAQNMIMSEGQNKPADIERHVESWIKANQSEFDGWVAAAKQAAQ